MSCVLVVEDESAIAELISINLRHAGYEVTIAATADQAQIEVDGVLPDLVVRRHAKGIKGRCGWRCGCGVRRR